MKLLLLLLLLPLPVTGQAVLDVKCGSLTVTATCDGQPFQLGCEQTRAVADCGGVKMVVAGEAAEEVTRTRRLTALLVSLFWLGVMFVRWVWKRRSGKPTPER